MINACSVASIFHGTDEHLASWLDGDAPYDSVYFSFISFQDCATGSLKECM